MEGLLERRLFCFIIYIARLLTCLPSQNYIPDAFFKFANYPQIHGKEKIGEFFRQHFAKYKMMQHQ